MNRVEFETLAGFRCIVDAGRTRTGGARAVRMDVRNRYVGPSLGIVTDADGRGTSR